jgi:hypothetical protein
MKTGPWLTLLIAFACSTFPSTATSQASIVVAMEGSVLIFKGSPNGSFCGLLVRAK